MKWFYLKEDADMKEAGEEFARMAPRLTMKFVELDGQPLPFSDSK